VKLVSSSSSNGIDSFIFEYSLFLITAARGTLDEPHTYGALRLLDAITRLTDIYSKFPEIPPDKFLLEVRDEIQRNLDLAMKSEDRLTEFMDGLIVKFTDEMKRRFAKFADVAEG
jgi:Family of unknown function (DUF6092)